MLRKATLAAASLALGLLVAGSALAAGKSLHPEPPTGGWTFDGPLGTFEQAQLQLTRAPYPFPTMRIAQRDDLFAFEYEDFVLEG